MKYKSIIKTRNNLSKIKDGAYVINLDEFKSIGTNRITLYVRAENVTYFDSFRLEHIPKEIRKFIGNKNVKTFLQEYKKKEYKDIIQ